MRLSLYTIKFNRTDYIRCELESILNQGWNKDQYELLVIDESDNNNNMELYREYANKINITYFKLKTPWVETELIKPLSNNRATHSLSLNTLISHIQSQYCIYLSGEFVFLDNAFETICTDRHQHICLSFNIPNICRTFIETKEMIITNWFYSYEKNPNFNELMGASVPSKYLHNMNGYYAEYMKGWQCEGNDIYNRLIRTDAEIVHIEKPVMAHIDHERHDADWKTVSSQTYRYAWKNRLLMDSGYYDDNQKALRYYRPGTEKNKIVCDNLTTADDFLQQYNLDINNES